MQKTILIHNDLLSILLVSLFSSDINLSIVGCRDWYWANLFKAIKSLSASYTRSTKQSDSNKLLILFLKTKKNN